MTEQEKKEDDIFLQAAAEALGDLIEGNTTNEDIIKHEEKIKAISKITDLNLPMRKWEELKESILGIHTKKFDLILEKLPDREFVRVYMKMIEYYIPKAKTQKEPKVFTKEKNTLVIVINRGREKEEEKIIDVTPQ